MGRDRGARGWEGEVEGPTEEGSGGGQGAETGGRRNKRRGGLKRAGDGDGRGGQASKAGRKLGNIVVVLPPP